MRTSTPVLLGGIGPDPKALAAGTFNPKREGKVLDVILNGDSEGTNDAILAFLLANPPKDYAGKIRAPTVRYFTKRAVEAGIIESREVAGRTVYIPLADGPAFARATPAGLAFRNKILEISGTPPPAPQAFLESAGADAAEAARSSGRGQGFASTKEARRAVELRAMEAATEHFTRRGYRVEDVSTVQSCDLRCRKGPEELYVEVKGTVTVGEEVFLTAGEVRFAEVHQNDMALFVLHTVEVTEVKGTVRATGGRPVVVWPWRIEPADLSALTFKYQVRANSIEERPRRRTPIA
jgi:hypothetical protein